MRRSTSSAALYSLWKARICSGSPELTAKSQAAKARPAGVSGRIPTAPSVATVLPERF